MKRRSFVTILLILAFTMYFAITVFFTSPDNFLSTSLYRYKQVFHTVFYQKWSFFAPPPNYNQRLYYEFINRKSGEMNVFEVTEPIVKAKQRKAPFNTDEEILDYIIFGSISGVTDMITELKKDKAYELYGDSNTIQLDTTIAEKIRKYTHKSFCYKTLENYAGEIAKKNITNVKDFDVRILISIVAIPKFTNRFKQNKLKEEFVFASDYFKIN
jgi:hypothetical protein